MSDFVKVKSFTVRKLQQRLDSFRTREKQLKGPIEGRDLEYQLRRLAKLSGVTKDVLFGSATGIDQCFRPEEKLYLFQLLNEIEENVRWKGINYCEMQRS